jgi:hypothetical protein
MLSTERIQELQHLLHDGLGLDYDFDRAHSASQQSRPSPDRSEHDEQSIRDSKRSAGRHPRK